MLAVAWLSPVFISVVPIFLGWYTTQVSPSVCVPFPLCLCFCISGRLFSSLVCISVCLSVSENTWLFVCVIPPLYVSVSLYLLYSRSLCLPFPTHLTSFLHSFLFKSGVLQDKYRHTQTRTHPFTHPNKGPPRFLLHWLSKSSSRELCVDQSLDLRDTSTWVYSAPLLLFHSFPSLRPHLNSIYVTTCCQPSVFAFLLKNIANLS